MRNILIALLIFISSCTGESSTVPISRIYHLPTIMVEIKGEWVEMILDTGGGVTVIDDGIAKRLGIKDLKVPLDITGYGGVKSMSLTNEVEIGIGNKTMFAPIYVSDINYITDGTPVGGILGIDHISSVNAVINLSENTVEVK